MSELFHSLGIEWPVMVAQLVNFAILVFLLGKFVYKPVIKAIDERSRSIALANEREEMITRRLSEIETEKAEILSLARVESQKIIEESKKGGEVLKKSIVASAEEERTRILAEAEKRRLSEKERLVADVRREIGTIVVDAIDKSFSDVLDARSQGRMVEQALSALRETEKKEKKI